MEEQKRVQRRKRIGNGLKSRFMKASLTEDVDKTKLVTFIFYLLFYSPLSYNSFILLAMLLDITAILLTLLTFISRVLA